MRDNKLVYSTDGGRISTEPEAKSAPRGDGIVRLHKQTKGRKGKGVTIIDGLDMDASQLKTLCTKLKKLCGCGGAVKAFCIEIQGENREKIKTYLEQQGYKVKLSGG